jgi:hypothetical protein
MMFQRNRGRTRASHTDENCHCQRIDKGKIEESKFVKSSAKNSCATLNPSERNTAVKD